jgi:iron complex transport system ATP-binding protein
LINNNKKELLQVDRFNFKINDIQILKDVSFYARKGEFIALIGPNGAGKTTLLKCINGINKGSGSIKINGRKLSSMTKKEVAAKVAMLHQDTTVAFPFSAIDIVMTGRYHMLGRLKPETERDYKAVRRYMEYTDTLRFENRLINTLSGGERQRVLFTKVLAQETELILLDEPSASLDIAHEEQIFKYCEQLCNKGKTVIAAVHDLKTAVRFCSRLILMKDGRIIADGVPDEVITKKNLSEAYGVNALVYKNRITGLVDFHVPMPADKGTNWKAHVIGGGGSASGVIRQLYEKGYSVTAGVFSHGDSDLSSVDVFGVQALVCQPFSEIGDEEMSRNIELIKEADITILCDMPFGYQNIKNLEAARYSPRLIIIEDQLAQVRDFTGGKALNIYNELKKNAIVVESSRLHEVLD